MNEQSRRLLILDIRPLTVCGRTMASCLLTDVSGSELAEKNAANASWWSRRIGD